MSLILSIETATEVCSVALHDNGKAVAECNLFLQKAHSTSLASLTGQIFELTGQKKTDLEAVAISKGPGSYTGLRIGTSLAKGICYGLDIPLISINTLEAMAWQVKSIFPGKILCPMIDARRMEVYHLLKDAHFNTIQETINLIIDSTSFSTLLKGQSVCFFGNGAEKCKNFLGNYPNALFVDNIHASAKYIGELAFKKYLCQDFEDLAYFEPYYLKEFVAGKPKKLV